MGPPELQQAKAMGYAVSLNSLNKLMPNFQYGFITFSSNLLEDNPDAGKRFLVAYLKGVQQYNQGKTPRNLEILGKYLGMDDTALNRAFWTPVYADARINQSDITAYQDFLQEIGMVEEKVNVDQLIDTRFLEYAQEIVKP
jgi:ABC-type nitrate/sulfonate/bicarbonate transport system substrate-binding protein